MPTINDEENDQEKARSYIPKSLIRAGFWAKNHFGEVTFASGIVMMGIALSLIFAVGGTAGIAGLFLVLVAGVLLCGKALYPESGDDAPSFDM